VRRPKTGFVVDANVLIDYANADLTVLTLAARGELNTDEAESVAWAIHETNPAFVTEAIVNEFKSKLRRLAPPFGV